MVSRARTTATVLLAAGLAASGPGQDTGRRAPAFLRVIDPAGAAVAGVEVHLAGGDPGFDASLVPVDVVTGRTDERGRLQPRILPGRCYVAWVDAPRGDGGERWLAEPDRYFGIGAMERIRVRSVPAVRRRPKGEEAWRSVGPLRWFFVTPDPGIEIPLERGADGKLALPSLTEGRIEVRTAEGAPLWSASPVSPLELPPPRRVMVRVVDETGRPIAGAVVRQRVARTGHWNAVSRVGRPRKRVREVGVTDVDGNAAFDLPLTGDPMGEGRKAGSGMYLTVRVPGRASVVGGAIGRRFYVNDRLVEEIEGDAWPFTLPAVDPLATPAGAVPPGTAAQLVAVCKLRGGGGGYLHDPRTFFAVAGPEGRLAFDGVPADLHSVHLSLRSADGSEAYVVPPRTGRSLPLALAEGGLLADLGRLRIGVTDADGSPLRGGVAVLLPACSNQLLMRAGSYLVPLDGAGRGVVRVARGDWIVALFTSGSFAAELVTVAKDRQEASLQLEPMSRMHLLVRQPNGRPVASARVTIAGIAATSTSDPVQRALYTLSRGVSSRWSRLRTDSAGRVAIPFLPVEHAQWRISVCGPLGSTPPVPLEANDEPMELEIR